MTTQRPFVTGWLRYFLIVLAGAGLIVFFYSLLDPSARRGEVHSPQPEVTPVPRASITGLFGPGLFPNADYAPSHVSTASNPISPPPGQPPELPFKFLGKVTDGGKTVVLLYGRGRTLTVRGTGPVDDDYIVDTIEEDQIVLRHLGLNKSWILKLTFQQPVNISLGSPDDTPQD